MARSLLGWEKKTVVDPTSIGHNVEKKIVGIETRSGVRGNISQCYTNRQHLAFHWRSSTAVELKAVSLAQRWDAAQ